MLRILCHALLCWLGVLEWLADWRDLRGLSWRGRLPRAAVWLLPLPLLASRVPWRRGAAGLALSAPLALIGQLAISSLLGRRLNPLLQLAPGSYPDRTISELRIPMAQGYLPALHIAPRQGAQAAVCVLHGSGCNKTYYAWRLADTLIARGLAVLLVDLDGHGDNSRLQSFPAISEDATAAVGWLREHYARVGLLGISLGGCVAAHAVAHGLAVEGLAVLESPPRLHYTRIDMLREARGLAQPRLLGLLNDCTAYYLWRAWQAPPIRATMSTRDLIAALDLPSQLSGLSVPLLLLYGGSDAIVKPAQAAAVRRAAPAHAEYQLIPYASHLTLMVTPAALAHIGDWAARTLSHQSPAASAAAAPPPSRAVAP